MGRSRVFGNKRGSALPESALVVPATLLALIAVIQIAAGLYFMLEEKVCCDRWARHLANESAGTIYGALKADAANEVRIRVTREGIYTHLLTQRERFYTRFGTTSAGIEMTEVSKHIILDESRFIRTVDLACAGITSALSFWVESSGSRLGGRDEK